jgi:iron complex transport system substrate-binding protein
MKKFTALLLAYMTLLTIAGCASSQPAGSSLTASEGASGASPQAAEKGGPITITDMLGRQVTVNGPVRRVVVDQWSTAEVLMTVGGEEIVDTLQGVGNTKSSEIVKKLYSEQYPALPDAHIGGGKGSTHDVEMIISLKPDVFIINSSGSFLDSTQETVDKLEKAGIPSVVLTMAEDPMASPQKGIALVGKLFGCEQRAGEIIDYIDAQFNLIRSKKLSERQNKPTVYQEKGSGTSEEYDVTSTSDGWASIIELTGGENIAKNAIGPVGKSTLNI